MSYKVLALKYRPQTFASVVGQEATLLALQHAIDKNQLHHAYLFTGTRGVGKTTLARILAKSLNCEQGISSKPCGTCEACLSIASGDNIDVIEIDAASKTRVEDTRDLLESVPYTPVRSRFKIYIIDEVHMLSNHSFNALLKTLEEPPAHVKFILATTDPQKLPVTVLSRCLQFHLRNLTCEQITTHLAKVLQQEEVTFMPQALLIIAQCANGSMRDALSLLEQVVAFGQRNVTVMACQEILGTAVTSQTLELLSKIIDGQAAPAIMLIRELAQNNADFTNVLKILQTFIHNLALVQVVPEALSDVAQADQLKQLAAHVSAQDLQLYYQTALLGARDLPYAPDIVTGFEMIVLRMIAFAPVVVNDDESLEKAQVENVVPASFVAPTQANASINEVKPVAKSPSASRQSWAQIIDKLNLTGLTKVIAENCTIAKWDNDAIVLTLHENQKPLLNAKNVEKLQVALQEYLKSKVKLTINIGVLTSESPAEQEQRLQKAAIDAAHQVIRTDQHVQELEKTFEAQITDIQIHEK